MEVAGSGPSVMCDLIQPVSLVIHLTSFLKIKVTRWFSSFLDTSQIYVQCITKSSLNCEYSKGRKSDVKISIERAFDGKLSKYSLV